MPKRYPFVIHGNYFGPGNPVSRKYLCTHRPVDRMDRYALKHDLGYAKLGRSAYWKYNKYDAQFIRGLRRTRVRGVGNKVKRALGLGFFGVKKFIAPRM